MERKHIKLYFRGEPQRTVFPITEVNGFSAEESEGGQGVSSCLDSNYYKGALPSSTFIVDAFNHSLRPEIGAVKTNEASPTSSSNLIIERTHGNNVGGIKNLPGLRGSRSEHTQLLVYPSIARIRRLTPLECERLQGFPDGWTEGLSDTQRYKCMGNAITVPVVTFLGKRILSLFSGV